MNTLCDMVGGPEKDRCCVRSQPANHKVAHLLCLLGFLGKKDSLDVGQNTSLSNGDTGEQFVQLLVVTDGQLQVTGDDPGLLVVTCSISSQLQNLSGQVFHDCSEVHWCTSSYAFGVVTFAQVAMDTADGELQTGTTRACLGLSL